MYLDRDYFTSHINEKDKVIEMRKLLDKIEVVINKHQLEKTNFMDPYEIYLAKSILNRFNEISYEVFGGYSDAERALIIIYPEYLLEKPKGDLVCLKIKGDFENIKHRDFLGAILNLGIDRNKIGDIVVLGDMAYVFAAVEISTYIIYNLEKISNIKISIELVELSEISIPEVEFKEVRKFLTSLRLDLVLSNVLGISRRDSLNLIKKNTVKVNHKTIISPSDQLEVKDLVSVRGYGRFYLHSIEGKSKKDKYLCIIRILI